MSSITSPYKTFSSKTAYKIWFGWPRCCIAIDVAVSSLVFSPVSVALSALTWDSRRRADDIISCTATDVDPLSAVLFPALKILYRMAGRLHLKCDGTCAETRFRLSAKRPSPFKSTGGFISVDYWQASCTHQPAGFVLLVRACVLQSCDAYWLPTPFSCFPFTSPPVRHRVPSHFKRSLLI
jgi:hypothetical protein